jgi:hypothetical protein
MPLTWATPRFQRGRCSGWPDRVLLRNSKLASTKRLDSIGAPPSITLNACQAFRVSIGVSA